MDEDKLSEKIQRELDEITKRKGHLLRRDIATNRQSIRIIDEFLKYNTGNIKIHKNLIALLILISNHLINDSVAQIIIELPLEAEKMLMLRLYLYMQMSNNFLDGFLLGRAFLKVTEGFDIFDYEDMDLLEVFKRVFLIRMRNKETGMIEKIDRETHLISHFEKAYRELFLTNSILLKDLAQGNIQLVVKYLMLTFFDGILAARVIADLMGKS
ncbi:MAG: hypothetical protein K8T10_08970 [Candidatus Eremiobacteraeota bacterium]|nr:hypothetical protein [Candidatus Eremiobacteraeota bacterium]